MATNGQPYLTSSLARRYYRQMKAGYANNMRSQPSSSGSTLDRYMQAQRQAMISHPGANPGAPAEQQSSNPFLNAGLKALDVIMQPAYAVAENVVTDSTVLGTKLGRGEAPSIKDWIDPITIVDDLGQGNDKHMLGDLVTGKKEFLNRSRQQLGQPLYTKDQGPLAPNESDNGLQGFAKGAAGFTADVLGDPLTYLTGGTAGAAVKGLGAGIKGIEALDKLGVAGKAIAKVGGGVEKVGETTIKVDDAINRGIQKAVSKTADTVIPGHAARKAAKAEAAAAEEASLAAAREAATMPELHPMTEQRLNGPWPEANPARIEELFGKQLKGPLDLAPPMLRDTATGDLRDFSARAAKSVLKEPKYDFSKVRTANNRPITPWELPPKKGEQAATKQLIEDALSAPKTVDEAAAKQATEDIVKATEPFPDAVTWVRSNPDVTTRFGKHVVSLKEHMIIANYKKFPEAADKVLKAMGIKFAGADDMRQYAVASNKALNEAYATAKAQHEGASALGRRLTTADAPTTARPVAADAPAAPAGPEAGVTGQNVLEEAQRKAEVVSGGRDWVEKSPQQRSLITRRYKQALEEEDFKYLFENYKNTAMTAGEKQKDFLQRLAELKGKKVERPRYEIFYHQQLMQQTRPGLFERGFNLLSENPSPKAVAGNEALATVETAAETVAKTDKSLAATAERQMTREEIRSGAALDDLTRGILAKYLGRGTDKIPGQQWDAIREDFAHRSARQGTLRNSPTPGVGLGVNREAFNAKTQGNIINEFFLEANKHLKANNLLKSGHSGAAAKMEFIMPRVRAYEEFLRAHGIEPIGGVTKRGVPVSFGDTIDALMHSEAGRSFVTGRIFGGAIGVPVRGAKGGVRGSMHIASLLRVMGAIVDNIDATAIHAARENIDVIEAIARTVNDTIKNKKITGETLDKAVKKEFRLDIAQDGTPYYGPSSQGIIRELQRVLFDGTNAAGLPDYRVLNAMAQTVQKRSAEYGIKFGDSVRQLSNDTMSEVFSFLDKGPGKAALVETLGDTDAIVKAVSKNHREQYMPFTEDEILGAQARIAEDLNDVVSLWDRKTVAASKGVSNAVRRGAAQHEINAASFEHYKNTVDQIEGLIPTEQLGTDIAEVAITDAAIVQKRLGFWLDRFVSSRIINSAGKVVENVLHQGFRASGSLGKNLTVDTARKLSHIAQTYSMETRKAAYDYLRRDFQGQVTDEVKQAAELFKPISAMMFDAEVRAARYGARPSVLRDFMQNGYSLEHIKDMMTSSQHAIPDAYQFKWDKIEKFKTLDEKFDEMHRQWQHDMTIDDPVDFLSRMDKVTARLATDMSISQGAWHKLTTSGLAATKPRPGFVRLTKLEASKVGRYFPAELDNVFVHKDVIPMVQRLDMLLSESAAFKSGPMRSMVALQDMWKAGVTVWRLGHHVRNFVGDTGLSWLADGVKNPKYFYRATKMLSERRTYDGVDMLAMLQHAPVTASNEGKFKLMANLGYGRKVPLTDKDFYEGLMRRGVIKDVASFEDLSGVTELPKVIENLQKGLKTAGAPLRAVGLSKENVGRLSEAREDLVRLTHALHLLDNKASLLDAMGQKSYKSLDEMMDAIAHRVLQVHPDGGDMTGFERKYMRAAFSFYSWSRKAIPLVIESYAQHPGRISMYPKFMYEQARQMGINPDSLSDPFPDDQLFPNYITDQITGPMYRESDNMHYHGISPGEVGSDTINQWLAHNPISTAADMINPIVKLPIELQTGSTLGEGIQTPKIDKAQYIGSQLPGISSIQSIFGADVLGSASTLVQGQGIDPITSVKQGNRNMFEPENLLNFFLGGGDQDMSTPSAIRKAQIEMRDRAAGR